MWAGGSTSGPWSRSPIRCLGDYNFNGLVDTADYSVWRDTLVRRPTSVPTANGNGLVDQPDYDRWRADFGKTRPPAAGGAAALTISPNRYLTLARRSCQYPTRRPRMPIRANTDTIRLAGVAMYEARPALHDSGSRPHQRINIFGAAKSVGDNLLLMLASDRLGRSSQRASQRLTIAGETTLTSTNSTANALPMNRLLWRWPNGGKRALLKYCAV